jgi:hypothetical protein
MASFDEIKPGVRPEGLDPSGTAEVVQVSRFGPDALNLVFRANGKVGERLFGFNRTGPDLKEVIDRQIERLVKEGQLHLDESGLRFSEG